MAYPSTTANDEPADAKIEVSVEDNSKRVWKYNVNIIHYDGTKKNVTFEVDIDNGTIKERMIILLSL